MGKTATAQPIPTTPARSKSFRNHAESRIRPDRLVIWPRPTANALRDQSWGGTEALASEPDRAKLTWPAKPKTGAVPC